MSQNTRLQGQFYYVVPLDLSKPNTVAQLPGLFATPGLGGVYLRMDWSTIQTGLNTFDLSAYLAVIAMMPPGMPLMLSIIGGLTMPSAILDVNGGPVNTLTLNVAQHPGGPLVASQIPIPDAAFAAASNAVWDFVASALQTAGYFNQVVGIKCGFAYTRDEETTVQAFSGLGPNLIRYDAQWASHFRPTAWVTTWLGMLNHVGALFPNAVMSLSTLSPLQAFPWIDDTGTVLTTSNSESVLASMVTAGVAAMPGRFGICQTGLGTSVDPFLLSLCTNGVQVHFQMQTSAGNDLATPAGFVQAENEGLGYGAWYVELHTPEVEACQAQITAQAPLYAALAASQNTNPYGQIISYAGVIISYGGVIISYGGTTATENDLLDTTGNVLQDTAGNNLLWG